MSELIKPLERDEYSILDHALDFRMAQLTTANPDGGDEHWFSVLLEIEGSIELFINNARAYTDDILVPVAYDQQDREISLPSQPLSMFARKQFLNAINRRPEAGNTSNQYRVISIHLGGLTPKRFLDFHAKWPEMHEHPSVDEEAVIMAVLDDGIGIANELFRDSPTSSRVQYASILDAEPLIAGSRTSVGRILDKEGIEKLFEQATVDSVLDEDLFYARSGQVDFRNKTISTVAQRSSHGSHVMSLAAGFEMEDARVDRPIICVSLPTTQVEDTTGSDLLPSLYLGFHMLVKQSLRFRTKSGKLVPVVFNFSFGNSAGPHDGSSLFANLFEHYFNPHYRQNEEERAIWLTLPAGNANLLRLHGVVGVEKKETAFDLVIKPDDLTISEVQIWMPHTGKATQEVVEIIVDTPFGSTGSIRTDVQDRFNFEDSAGGEFARLSYRFVGGQTQRGLALLSISPTVSHNSNQPLAEPGNWKIRIRRGAVALGRIHLWIRRDETLPGFAPGGRQAYFANECYQRFGKYGEPLTVDPIDDDCPVRRSMTISGFACSSSPVVVGSYMESERMLSPYSSSGPLNDSSLVPVDRDGPDLTAKGDDSGVLRGVLGAGSRSGSLVRRMGTSVAAPRVARAASNVLSDPLVFKWSAREWATDPSRFGRGVHRYQLSEPAEKERQGSGAYEMGVFKNPTRPFDKREI